MQWITNHKLDKLDEKVDFYKSPTLFGSPALSLILRCQAELIDSNMSFGIAVENTDRIIWAQIGPKVIGGIAYKFEEFARGQILLSFTDPEYRGLGINLLCKKHCENDCIDNHMTHIVTTIHVHNYTSYNNNVKMGLTPMFTTLIKQLKKS
jgi:hypothetical protein